VADYVFMPAIVVLLKAASIVKAHNSIGYAVLPPIDAGMVLLAGRAKA
jgi:hypothetical protein